MDEDVELDEDTRRYIVDVHDAVDRIAHSELLRVARDADKKTIKRAYFRLAATLHPDRHFGKKLGSFKAKMEFLFRKISDAHDVLLNEAKRAHYDSSLGAVTRARPAAQAPEDPRAAAQRKLEEAEAARLLAEARTKAKVHVDAAERASRAGDLAAALAAYRNARTLLPNDKELEQAMLAVQRTFAERASESIVRQALLEEKHGHWPQAVNSWKRAAAARPHDQEVRARLANAIAKSRDSSR